MTQEELMLGDWVIRKNVPDEKLTVVAINLITKLVALDLDGRGVIEISTNIDPIPITPEILEKNGFKFYCTDVFEEWKSKDKRITIHDEEYPNSFNKWSVHVDTEDMRTMGYFEITYVHELQHALRLCGINKKIEI